MLFGKVGECKTRNSLVESVTGCECGCELCVTGWDLSLVCVSTRLTLLHGFVSMIMLIVRTMNLRFGFPVYIPPHSTRQIALLQLFITIMVILPCCNITRYVHLHQHDQHHHNSHIKKNHLAQSQHKRRCLLEKLETPPHIGKNKNAPLTR